MPENRPIDPRHTLVQNKYYTHVPDPLFDLFVAKRIPRAAILVFLTYWKAGMIHGDFCAEIPIETVAERCGISTSAVTRAYQILIRHKLICRIDPGRDASRPFRQAVALTEVRLPESLLSQLHQYPNRGGKAEQPESPCQPELPPTDAHNQEQAKPPIVELPDPLAGFTGKSRIKALKQLLAPMSAPERARYDEALSKRLSSMPFDSPSGMSPEQQRKTNQHLALMARPRLDLPACSAQVLKSSGPPTPRRLSTAELARIRRGVLNTAPIGQADELVRQIAWSIEEGALNRFTPLHASRIALKKLREGAWQRPHRMPPNWALKLTQPVRPSLNEEPRPTKPAFNAQRSPSSRPPQGPFMHSTQSAGSVRPVAERLIAWTNHLASVPRTPSYAGPHNE